MIVQATIPDYLMRQVAGRRCSTSFYLSKRGRVPRRTQALLAEAIARPQFAVAKLAWE